MVTTKKAPEKPAKSAKSEAQERQRVFKGFYLYKDQYDRMLELSVKNKIAGTEPSSQSEILRAALDAYLK